MKRTCLLLLTVFLALSLAACNNEMQQYKNGITIPSKNARVVGISMPNDTDLRWASESAALVQQLKDNGFTPIVHYAQNDVSLQVSQIKALIEKPVGCLVIAAIDSLSLTDVLLAAKQAGIPVIAYDRLLMQTDAVAGYVGCDYQALGVAMAEHIVNTKQLETAQAENRSHTIEFFMGSPDDNNAVLLYAGILQVLQPYLDCGVLTCRTGRTDFEDVCIQDWSAELAETLCQSYFAAHYPDAPPEILCAASDQLADGCVSALEATGYASAENWPLITGQGSSESATKRLSIGEQSLTVHISFADLPAICLQSITAALDTAPALWEGPVCYNGTISVPARFCEFALAERS